VGPRAGHEALKKTELSCPCQQLTIVSSVMFDVLTNNQLKCAATYRIRLHVAKVIYAASTTIEVLGNQAFMYFSVICCPLEF